MIGPRVENALHRSFGVFRAVLTEEGVDELKRRLVALRISHRRLAIP